MKFTHLAGLHTYVCPKFERADESEHRLTYFTKEEVDRLCFLAVDLYDRQDLADAIKFSAYTGVRQGELLKLRPEDVDVARSQIWVGGKPTLVTKGKNVRNITLHPSIEQMVMDPLGPEEALRR